MSDIRKVGAIGLKTVIFYLCTTAFAVTIGLTGGNLFKGLFPVVATTDLTYEAARSHLLYGYTGEYVPVQLRISYGRGEHAADHRHGCSSWICDYPGR